MNSLSTVQSNAVVASIPASQAILNANIDMIKNGYDLDMNSFEIGQQSMKATIDAILGEGKAEAAATRYQAIGQMSAGITSSVMTIASSGFSLKEEISQTAMKDQMSNLSSIEEGALNPKMPADVNLSADPSAAVKEVPAPDLDKIKNTLKSDAPIEEKLKQLTSNNNKELLEEYPDYYTQVGNSFSGDADAKETIGRIKEKLNLDMKESDRQIQSWQFFSKGFADATQGLITGSFATQTANEQLEQSREKSLQSQAQFMLEFCKSIQDNASQQVQKSQQTIQQLISDEQTIARASTAA